MIIIESEYNIDNIKIVQKDANIMFEDFIVIGNSYSGDHIFDGLIDEFRLYIDDKSIDDILVIRSLSCPSYCIECVQ